MDPTGFFHKARLWLAARFFGVIRLGINVLKPRQYVYIYIYHRIIYYRISQHSMFQFFDVLKIIAVLGVFEVFSNTGKHC